MWHIVCLIGLVVFLAVVDSKKNRRDVQAKLGCRPARALEDHYCGSPYDKNSVHGAVDVLQQCIELPTNKLLPGDRLEQFLTETAVDSEKDAFWNDTAMQVSARLRISFPEAVARMKDLSPTIQTVDDYIQMLIRLGIS